MMYVNTFAPCSGPLCEAVHALIEESGNGNAFHVPQLRAGEQSPDGSAGLASSCVHCGKELSGTRAASCGTSCPCCTQTKILALLLTLGVVATFLYVRDLPVTRVGTAGRIRNNLREIALAMHNYLQANGRFPPAYLADKQGRPMHSWRVLLLPFLGQKSLYDQYRFDEPWDSPNNRRVTDEAVMVYQCPSRPDRNVRTTDYMIVVGPHTISDGPHGRKPADIKDGFSNTIMIVEVADSATPWAEPRNLKFDEINFQINNGRAPGIGSHHACGATVARCDGSVQFLDDSTDPKLIRPLLTIDGGETIPPER